MKIYDDEYLRGLLRELCKLPNETEWVEFKENDINPDKIGSYISALSNSAALQNKSSAYLIWGVEDKTHNIVGTTFYPSTTKIGNEELENWLLQKLSPKLDFVFYPFEMDEKRIVLLEIPMAYRHPVSFKYEEYIRIGSYLKRIKDHKDKERNLWKIFDKTPFEALNALENLSVDDVLLKLDYSAYFELLGLPIPDGNNSILDVLISEELVSKSNAGSYIIKNLGAVLFAKKLEDFPKLSRKAVRVIRYNGDTRISTTREQVGGRGYASGFNGLIDYVRALLPSNEVIGKALRKDVPMYPDLAIRELVANAIIHQDLYENGTSPMIEIFDTRIEITNPGMPLIDITRFLDSPPKSRNEKLAGLMRRFGVCEERGSGIDKVVSETERYQLPAPLFEAPKGYTKITMFAYKDFENMDMEERGRACYLHCCLQYVNKQKTNNLSLRDRFALDSTKASVITRVINSTVKQGLITKSSTSRSLRDVSYVPSWSVTQELT